MRRKIPITQVDAFTSQPFGGNAAAVVLDAHGISESEMRTIAREMNLSETAFLTVSSTADFRLRWFTPGAEVKFCGHATVATGHALHEAGLFPGDRVVFETLGGRLGLARTGKIFWLEPEPRKLTFYGGPLDPLLAALELTAADLAGWGPPTLSHEHAVLLPCRSLEVLRRAQPSAQLGKELTRLDLHAMALISLETIDPESKSHSRFFAPHLGVAEDPVTGSMHASLAVFLHGLGFVPNEFVAEQGDIMGRPGRLRIECQGPRVGGEAVTVLRGELEI